MIYIYIYIIVKVSDLFVGHVVVAVLLLLLWDTVWDKLPST